MPLIVPVLVPFVTAAVSLLAWRRAPVQRLLGAIGAAGLLTSGIVLLVQVRTQGIQTSQIGGWPAPYGITFVADHFSALMVLVTGVIGLSVAVYSLVEIDGPRQSFGYFPLLHIMLTGVTGAFLTGDMFNLYVWFEVMLISSFVLLALGSERPQLEGALKYVTLNLVSSFLFLTAVGILYGEVGTLNMAHAARRIRALGNPDLVAILAMLFFISFGIKAAVFPLFFWLPASYHTPPAAVSAVFAGLLTKVGVYALIRTFTLVFGQLELVHTLVLILAGFTMVTGVLGAIAQDEFRRILSFHIISQIGYMILGLGLYTPLALAGSVFYIVHHIVVKTNLFLIGGIVRGLEGSERLERLGGLYNRKPWLALLFAIPALSLAGLPPLSGFVAKLALVRAGLEVGEYALVGVALGVSLLTLYSMAKIWNAVFWEAPSDTSKAAPGLGGGAQAVLAGPAAMLALLTVCMGLLAGPAFLAAEAAAAELLDPERYIYAVLGDAS
ncbi:MAG: Na+/H+ antiporter subunit D [Planctomycetes bacterium]|nr:Na+/H+ antiporter subunit D [Planctomycetota bacterium]